MSYTKINWQNLPNTTTPINATNLNHMEDGIAAAHGTNGTWTPVINALSETAPTITYTTRTGRYKKINNLVWISFYIRGKITAVNGTNNYAVIEGLPATPLTSNLGQTALNLGVMYSLCSNQDDAILSVYDGKIRIQINNGSAAGRLQVTPTTYFEIGGSGWYEISE